MKFKIRLPIKSLWYSAAFYMVPKPRQYNELNIKVALNLDSVIMCYVFQDQHTHTQKHMRIYDTSTSHSLFRSEYREIMDSPIPFNLVHRVHHYFPRVIWLAGGATWVTVD